MFICQVGPEVYHQPFSLKVKENNIFSFFNLEAQLEEETEGKALG